ncbi:uncharacterized protein J3D65DRAFT_671737 [Phyllosticta citribraziliensis]|uniref:Uncharacterized protein n=1 Tax=Phyllosticta citribraziliensis TaxID=989973 RepID=A0ABR1L6F5_9PEZI
MAPIRRYLRITRHSALEVRIYLDNPAYGDTWLLRQTDPALPRIIDAVRPLVLPKLWEEKERAKGRGKGKKGVKDVVTGDDFEVSIFLTDNSTPHSLLTKNKKFNDKPRLKSNSGKLTGWLVTGKTVENPVDLDVEKPQETITIMDEEEGQPLSLSEIPEAPTKGSDGQPIGSPEGLFVNENSSESEDASGPSSRRGKRKQSALADDDEIEGAKEDKKKLLLNTSYDGFSIYGRILCLVVKRKGAAAKGSGTAGSTAQAPSSQQMMENWVSTQAAANIGAEEDGDD